MRKKICIYSLLPIFILSIFSGLIYNSNISQNVLILDNSDSSFENSEYRNPGLESYGTLFLTNIVENADGTYNATINWVCSGDGSVHDYIGYLWIINGRINSWANWSLEAGDVQTVVNNRLFYDYVASTAEDGAILYCTLQKDAQFLLYATNPTDIYFYFYFEDTLVGSFNLPYNYTGYLLGSFTSNTLTDWWNITWDYRYKVILTAPSVTQPDSPVNIFQRINEPIDVYLEFPSGTCHENSIRVTYYNGSSWNLIQSQIWNKTYYSGNFLSSCTVTFLANISYNLREIYYIYFDPNVSTPDTSFTNKIWAVPEVALNSRFIDLYDDGDGNGKAWVSYALSTTCDYINDDFEDHNYNEWKDWSNIALDTSNPYQGEYCLRLWYDKSGRHLTWKNESLGIPLSNNPVISWAIKCPSGTTTNLFANIDGTWYSIAKTPSGAHGSYSAAPNQITMIDDGTWHAYSYNLNQIAGTYFNAFEFWNDASASNSHVFYVDSINVTNTLTEASIRDFEFIENESAYSDPNNKFPMQGGEPKYSMSPWARWTPHQETSDWRFGFDDIPSSLDHFSWYSAFVIYSPSTRTVNMLVGSDDGIKVWKDGILVHNNNTDRSIAKDQDSQIITLNQGLNYFLVKVDDNTGDTAWCMRFTTSPGGTSITDLKQYIFGPYPTVYYSNGTSVQYCDSIQIYTELGVLAKIKLVDDVDLYDDYSGPVCGLIRANYGTENALSDSDPLQYFQLNEFPFDKWNSLHNDADYRNPDEYLSSSGYRHDLIVPDNPATAWDGNGRVEIIDNGPLMVRIKITTTDGGYVDLNDEQHNSGYMNFTFYYTFYYQGKSTFVKFKNFLQAQRDCYVRNYPQYPRVFGIFTDNVPMKQNQHAWHGVLSEDYTGGKVYNESSSINRKDYPVEPWVSLYDNISGSDPGIGIITTENIYGWEINSYHSNSVDSLMIQQILKEGHQGDYHIIYSGTILSYEYYVHTFPFGQDYKETQLLAYKLNNPITAQVALSPELFQHNFLTVTTVDIDGKIAAGVTVHLYNQSALIESKITDSQGQCLFERLADGTYTINVTYQIGSIVHLINETSINLDHTISRGKDLNIKCTLTTFNALVVDWDSQIPLISADISLINATSGLTIITNTTLSDGTCSFWLPPASYYFNISYGNQLRDYNVSKPYTITSEITEVIGCVVTEHITTLDMITSNATYNAAFNWWECYWQDLIEFIVYYNDSEASSSPSGITNATIKSWSINIGDILIAQGSMTELPGQPGNYSLHLNMQFTPGILYRLEFYFDKDVPTDYIPGFESINLKIMNWTTELTLLDPITQSIPWGNSTTIHLIYNNTQFAPPQYIEGATVSCDWDASYYSIMYGVGKYNVTIDTSCKSLDETITLKITLSKANLTRQSVEIAINIRTRNSELIYQAPNPTPAFNNVTIDLYYRDLDNYSAPIGNESGKVKLAVNHSQSYWVNWESGTDHYTVILSSENLLVGTYSVQIDISYLGAPYFENRTVYVNFAIRNISTIIFYDYISRIPWGNNLEVTLYYNASDSESIYDGIGLSSAQITITSNNFVFGVNYSVVEIGNGKYTLTIYNHSFNGLPPSETPYTFDLYAGGVANYSPATVSGLKFWVENLTTSIETVFPTVPWGNPVNITLAYKVSDSSSQYHDGEYISAASINITSHNFVYNVNYTVFDLGGGNYIIQIFNNSFNNLPPGTYQIIVTASGVENRSTVSRSINFTVRKLLTDISIAPVND
ncbi:MAG: MSCRAMM family protein, partial [Candidatus Helarchaeota archaeon]